MKKILAIVLAMALLCITAIGTTLSYFKDSDYDKNVMTVGKVDITQSETDRDGNSIDNEHLALYPVTAGPAADGLVPVENNGVDKFVSVTLANDSEPAYVRTVFAFELKKINGEWQSALGPTKNVRYITKDADGKPQEGGIDFSQGLRIYLQTSGRFSTVEDADTVSAFEVGFYNFGKVADSTPRTSLMQVYLDSGVGNAFTEYVGGSYEVLVVSQAAQAQGFASADAAFATVFSVDSITDWFK